MSDDLKRETAKGVVWSGIDKIANGGIQFLANIVLARLLTPKDFGLLAIIAIFIQISQTFIDSGFSNALIQKKDRSQTDYSTVFFFNLALSIGFYVILFLCAPFIAGFFENDKLISLTKIVGLNLIIGALVSVHKTRLTIQLRFKIQAVISLISSFVSAVIAIWMAYNGYGVWSLVALTITNITFQMALIYIMIKWRPSLLFSKTAFTSLFSYSSKLLGASLIHLLYRNIYPIIIGKKFSPVELGYFNRADTFAMYPPYMIGSVISRVAFPIFSRIQDDEARLRNAYSKYIVFASLIIFPILTGLLVLAEPLTLLILKKTWLPMVPMLQILCIDWMTDHLCTINLNVLYVKGRSDLAFKLELIKKSLALGIFFISLHWGIIGVCWGRVLYGIIAVYLNSFYTKRLIKISLYQQLKDIATPLSQSAIMGAIIYVYINSISLSIGWKILTAISIGFISYYVTIRLLKAEYIKEVKQLLLLITKKRDNISDYPNQ